MRMVAPGPGELASLDPLDDRRAWLHAQPARRLHDLDPAHQLNREHAERPAALASALGCAASVVLVGRDVVLTARHAWKAMAGRPAYVVFGYLDGAPFNGWGVEVSTVVRVAQPIAVGEGQHDDWILLGLHEPPGVDPVPLRSSNHDESLTLVGHALGMPKSFAAGGRAYARAGTKFFHTCSSSNGDSGAALFVERPGEGAVVVGMNVSGLDLRSRGAFNVPAEAPTHGHDTDNTAIAVAEVRAALDRCGISTP